MEKNKARQMDLPHIKAYSFGGRSLKKRRKTKRPLVAGLPTHVVFKSSKATGEHSFYRHKSFIKNLLNEKSKKFSIEILDMVNMGNHLHLKVKFKESKKMGQFLKSFTAMLAREVTGAKKGKRFGKFWDGLAYTRVLTNEAEEAGVEGYFQAGAKELSKEEQAMHLKTFNQFLYRLKRTRARSKWLLEVELD